MTQDAKGQMATHENGLATVFRTGALNHSATHPGEVAGSLAPAHAREKQVAFARATDNPRRPPKNASKDALPEQKCAA